MPSSPSAERRPIKGTKGERGPSSKKVFRLVEVVDLAIARDYSSLRERYGLNTWEADVIKDSIEGGRWRVVGEGVKGA